MSENVKKTVKWFLLAKNPPVIKFEEDEDSYVISDNVLSKSNFEKYPIKQGDVVEVGIKDNEVTFLKKQNPFANKAKSTSESKSKVGTSGTKTLTVEAVYKDESIKFKEEMIDGKKWTPVSNELSAQGLKNVGVVAKNQIIVTLENGVIVAVDVLASEKEETKSEQTKSTEKTYARKSSSRDEESTDKRTALMTAKDLVIALINSSKVEKESVKKAIDDLTKSCYETLQNL